MLQLLYEVRIEHECSLEDADDNKMEGSLAEPYVLIIGIDLTRNTSDDFSNCILVV
jgi:hypothetical protein